MDRFLQPQHPGSAVRDRQDYPFIMQACYRLICLAASLVLVFM
jgi:hypothetical protein